MPKDYASFLTTVELTDPLEGYTYETECWVHCTVSGLAWDVVIIAKDGTMVDINTLSKPELQQITDEIKDHLA